ncbi:MAG: DUF3662 domain-containing protein [Bifidobacteriaceae bacterium]|jgi:hypothetical protein|nr:DUF3662 domain-containing protein [Bifidobacteriaceae bacterium]
MSFFEKFENGIENAVNSVFSKFGSNELKPVDLMTSLKNEIDTKAVTLPDGRVEIPNRFSVTLSSDSYDKVESWGAETFADELSDSLVNYATQQGFTLFGPINIRFQEDLEMGKAQFAIESEKVDQNGNMVKEKHSKTPENLIDEPEPTPPTITPTVVQPAAASVPATEVNPASFDFAASGSPQLVIDEQIFELSKPQMILGRDENADISINDKGISRRHLKFKIDGRKVIVSDMGSTNGLFVEGHHTPAALLQNGNVITIGRTKINFHQL